ncbi:glycosyltransferase family 2 protein [Bradyrhizobium genosp. P]|uniref:glycosyltransferase family 2 protein n=1 Tax=Bradyrhizobium genosp. P TaxID=83641 RepID=UPI003CF85A47
MKISVYIPTRNRVDLLAAAVRSVLAQQFTDLELIVVDDASTDATASFLESITREDKRVRALRNESPRGAPVSRNRAITQATGDFITGLDDDDTFGLQRLSALHDCWASYARHNMPVSCIYTQDVFLSGGKELFVTKKRGTVEFADLAEANHIGNQVFAPTSVFREAGLFDQKLPAWQDLEFFIRIVKQFGPARLLDMPLYRFDVTPSRDRISSKQDRVRNAYELVSSLHFQEDSRARQKLMLQVFTAFYGIKPTLKDLARFAALGFWPHGWATLLKKVFWL